MPKRLSEAQVRRYHQDGFIGPVPVLSRDEVARYRAGLEDFERRSGARLDFPERSKSHLLFDWADAIVHHPAVLDAVEDLIGPDILVYHLTMHIKEPGTVQHIVWHQDDDYFHLAPAEHVTAWVALSQASEQSGCMRMMPGVHTQGPIEHREDPRPDHLIRLGKGIHGRFGDDDGVAVPVPAGSMSLHHTHTPHRSGPNRGSDRRIGVGISYIPAHVRPLTEPRSSALLVRGVDRHGHFHAETRLAESESPAARAAHARAYERYMAATGITR
ncbi:MAG: phytanoyl-CoA dioxygenase family protein [Gammaproteobacteria bacterium]|nr:phytanoyl-CoA dioxygenase family protein [Gammaproteobacteria bacterium]